MHFSKIVLTTLLLSAGMCAYAQNWAYAPNSNIDVYVDKSNILKNEKGVFYLVKHFDETSNKNVCAIIQTTNENNAGVVKAYTEENCKKIKSIGPVVKNLSAKNMKVLTKDSPLYNANALARSIILPENINSDPNIYKYYMISVQNKIKSNWNPPKSEKSNRAVARFKVARNGELKNVSIIESSGDFATDNSAIQAIKQSAPFRPFPPNAGEEEVDIEFTFDYNVWQGQNKI